MGNMVMLFHVSIQCTKCKNLCTTSVLKSHILNNYYNVLVERHTTITMYSIHNITTRRSNIFTSSYFIFNHLPQQNAIRTLLYHTSILFTTAFFNVFPHTRIVIHTYFSCFEKSELSLWDKLSLLLIQNAIPHFITYVIKFTTK